MEGPSPPQGSNQVVGLIASIRRDLLRHPSTALVLGLLIVIPGLQICRFRSGPSLNSRGEAELFEISRRARLVQSFRADPTSEVPLIWRQRLQLEVARDRWSRHGTALWWLIWLDDGQPVLALPKPSEPSTFDLLFADELHRSSFHDLPPITKRSPSSLERNCLQRLTTGTAVQWQPSGLASISGPLFSALGTASHGCLSVVLQGDRLSAEGPVASRPFASLNNIKGSLRTTTIRSLAPEVYLDLNSVSLQPLLGALLNNPLIDAQLSSRYGLSPEFRDLLLDAPVAMHLQPIKGGRYRASVQARLMVPADQRGQLEHSLKAVSEALLRRGFKRVEQPLFTTEGSSSRRAASVWLDPQGDPSGGWSLGPIHEGRMEFLISLGESPNLRHRPLQRRGQQLVRLRGRPADLTSFGWLGSGWPSAVRTASQLDLEMTALPREQDPGWIRVQLDLR